ncbi:unnamed protein product [Spirodela intermedia]|uniref:Dof zinc finger protein n=1 Tax=Spirodela intermedia TaxID=51605 RepID=A0A7I8L2Q2_SPIIN|nr:unnamed protein product [Spirodela intermedia]
MIQELLGGGQVEANKIPIVGGSSSSSPLSSGPPSPAAAAAAPPPFSSATNSDQQNLRCPRCDSTNTKFCYYNNYNLTQPRHFCKTCRRYWTKGGALRNVPIGGGCRKAKTTGVSVGPGRSTKAKTLSSSDAALIKSSLGGLSVGPPGFEQELPSSQILWPSPPNSQLLTLLRSTVNNTSSNSRTITSNPNPSPNPNSVRIKEEAALSLSHLVPDASLLRNALNARNLGFDHLSQVPQGLSSPWNSNQHQHGGFLFGETSTTGIQELYQRMRSHGQHHADHPAKSFGNAGPPPSSTISSSSPGAAVAQSSPLLASTAASGPGVLETATLVGGEFGYWSSPFAWADMSTTNGSFP